MPSVLVSAASARQVFHGCEPDYIATTCKGACCRSAASTIIVTLLDHEQAEIRRLTTIPVRDGLLAPDDRRCPFQTPENLCALHGGGVVGKPFGCIASPFTLTKRDVLVVRNRYRLLRCYRDGVLPAYRAFASSLVLLFGADVANILTEHLDRGGGDIWLPMPDTTHGFLRDGDTRKVAAVAARPPR